ncbi:MAG: S-layer homology domain-containing protein [Eubacteriales bacterium]
MPKLKSNMLRTLLQAVFAIGLLLLIHNFAQPVSAAQDAGSPALSAGGLQKAPALAADTSQNVVRKPVELTFADDAAWRGAISGVSVDGAALDAGKYAIDAGKITIDKTVFKVSGEYSVSVSAGGYADALVTQKIGLLCITGNGVRQEVVFTLAELEAMDQERTVFSATNDFPYDLFLAVEGVPLRSLLERAGMKPEARMITFTGTDGYKAEFTVNELLQTKRYLFPAKTEAEPVIALKRVERSSDFSRMNEQDTPVLCIGQRAQTEQTLLSFVRILQDITVTTDPPGQWAGPEAKIIDPETGQKAATTGGMVKLGSEVILEGDPKTKIYYTTDGSTPDLDSKIYNAHGCGPLAGQHGQILVQADTTVKAKAVWPGKLDSETAAFIFMVANQPATGGPPEMPAGESIQNKEPVSGSGPVFTDIGNCWAREDIETLALRGLVKGRSGNCYEPGGEVTRAEFAALMVRALGLQEKVLGEGQFDDVAVSDWYAGSATAAAAQGIIAGFDGRLFKPDNSITREEMAVMIIRAARIAGKEENLSAGEQEQQLSQFRDRQMISSWAMKEAATAVQAGIIKGTTGQEFAPQTVLDRAQSAAILKRFLTYINTAAAQ